MRRLSIVIILLFILIGNGKVLSQSTAKMNSIIGKWFFLDSTWYEEYGAIWEFVEDGVLNRSTEFAGVSGWSLDDGMLKISLNWGDGECYDKDCEYTFSFQRSKDYLQLILVSEQGHNLDNRSKKLTLVNVESDSLKESYIEKFNCFVSGTYKVDGGQLESDVERVKTEYTLELNNNTFNWSVKHDHKFYYENRQKDTVYSNTYRGEWVKQDSSLFLNVTSSPNYETNYTGYSFQITINENCEFITTNLGFFDLRQAKAIIRKHKHKN